MKTLLKEYRQSLKDIKALKEKAPEHEQKIYAGMITDLQYAVDWLRTGRRPGDRKSIHRIFVVSDPAASKAFEKIENEN